MSTRHWQIFWWFLFIVWITCDFLNMKHIRAGVLTSYGADITIPAWLYIATRSLDNPKRTSRIRKLFWRTPETTALVLFFASSLTEVSQYYSPGGFFPVLRFRGIWTVWVSILREILSFFDRARKELSC